MRVLARERERAPDVLLTELSHVAPRKRHAALFGIEEAQEEIRDGRLAGSARPDERDPPTRVEPEVEVAERGLVARRVTGGHAFERHDRVA